MPRERDAEFTRVVGSFLARRRWRHTLTMGVGVALLVLGSATVAAHLTQHGLQDTTPSTASGLGLYGAGASLYAWGGAKGFTRTLLTWLPATVLLGVLAVAVFTITGLLAEGAIAQHSSRVPTGVGLSSSLHSGSTSSPGGVLAAIVLDRAEVELLLGPVTGPPRTPGRQLLRQRSQAIWTAAPPGVSSPSKSRAGREPRPARLAVMISRSDQAADRLRGGHLPARAQRLADIGENAYVQSLRRDTTTVTRVVAVRGSWVAALQLDTSAALDPTQQLAAHLVTVLSRLIRASAGA